MTVYNQKFFKSWLSLRGKDNLFTDYLYDLIAHTGAELAANPEKKKLHLHFTLPEGYSYSYTVENNKQRSIIL